MLVNYTSKPQTKRQCSLLLKCFVSSHAWVNQCHV